MADARHGDRTAPADGRTDGVPRATQAVSDRLKWSTIFPYGAPGPGAGYMYLLLGLYVMKFSTDVLLIAPAVMGTIFGISRIWDAVSDPLAGYLSDLTRAPLGRRRTWMLASTIPIAGTFIMVFSPPAALEGTGLTLWMAAAIIGFYSAMTVFMVPHMSLGAELSIDYHERSRLFGLRHAGFTSGSILALISMSLFISAESEGRAAAQATTSNIAWIAGIATMALILWAVLRLRENPEYQGRVQAKPFRAYADIWRNPHARLLIGVTFIEHLGQATIATLTLYVAQYIIGRAELAPLLILCYMIPSTLSVPIWLPLARRFGKIRLWVFSLALTALAFGGMFSLPFIEVELTRLLVSFILAFFAGLAAGCGGTVSPSIQGDVIDFDEYLTGERKEGSYFAAWNFVHKGATGVMMLLTGYVLQVAGFVPNEPQTMTVKVAIAGLYGLFPMACYGLGALLFSRFTLDERAFRQIRAELDRRNGRG